MGDEPAYGVKVSTAKPTADKRRHRRPYADAEKHKRNREVAGKRHRGKLNVADPADH